jgi:hypothetical protein
VNAIFVRVSSRAHLILLALLLTVYAAFPARTYYWDGVLFALNIESVAQGHASPALLIHPNHLLYSAFGYVLYRAVLACGLMLRAIAVLQFFNMLASTAAAALLYRIAKRVTDSARSALFCATLFAFGATWWKFSTDADAYIVTVLLLLFAIFFVFQDPPRLVLAALCHTAAMLFHQLAIFAYCAILAAILLDRRWPKRKRLWVCGAYIFGTGACVAAVYWICYSQADHSTYPSLARFVASYASDSGFTRSFGQILNSYLTSYGRLFVGGKLSLAREYFSVVSCAAFVLCLAALGFAVGRFRRAGAEASTQVDRRTKIVLWAWLLPYLMFLASWDPGSAFHKLFVWPAIVLALGLYLPLRGARVNAWVAIAIAMAAWNFGAFVYPHSHASADPVLVLAQKLNRELPKNATIYYAAFSPDDWYLDYFAPGRNWIKLIGAPPPGPFCLDTTALTALAPGGDPTRGWKLVNSQHNIRLECFSSLR